MRYSLTNPKLSGKLLGLLWLLPLIALAEPKVVASIKPVHSLVAGVMQGIGEPRLLVPGGASPHQYSLRPSDARAISEADVVFWIGPELESFASKPLRNTEGKLRAVALLDAPGVVVLPLREGGAWEPHRHDAMADESTAHPVEQDHERKSRIRPRCSHLAGPC
ncbi:MAG: zinc ABC transporter substrate-binding protein [Candidatus Competibacter sp.]